MNKLKHFSLLPQVVKAVPKVIKSAVPEVTPAVAKTKKLVGLSKLGYATLATGAAVGSYELGKSKGKKENYSEDQLALQRLENFASPKTVITAAEIFGKLKTKHPDKPLSLLKSKAIQGTNTYRATNIIDKLRDQMWQAAMVNDKNRLHQIKNRVNSMNKRIENSTIEFNNKSKLNKRILKIISK